MPPCAPRLPFTDSGVLVRAVMPPTTPFSRYAVPLMAMTGPAPPEGRLATGLPRLDPYKCQSACTNPASLGVCPPKAAAKAAAFLQLELTAPTPPTGAARPALPLQPQMMSGGMGVSPSTVPISPLRAHPAGRASVGPCAVCLPDAHVHGKKSRKVSRRCVERTVHLVHAAVQSARGLRRPARPWGQGRQEGQEGSREEVMASGGVASTSPMLT